MYYAVEQVLAMKGLESMKLKYIVLCSTLFLVIDPAQAQKVDPDAAKTVKQTPKVVVQTHSVKSCPFGDCELKTKIQTACDQKPKGTAFTRCARTVVIGQVCGARTIHKGDHVPWADLGEGCQTKLKAGFVALSAKTGQIYYFLRTYIPQ